LIEAAAQRVHFTHALRRLRQVIEEIVAREDASAFGWQGIEVINGPARFVGPRTLAVPAGLYAESGR
jgi:pyruvate/2-oxoglutarate dehydrogenase complex dihydrolipoamide dehydrogenase (E3) component